MFLIPGILARWEVVGYFLWWQWDAFDIMFGQQHSAESSRKDNIIM
jgi:hypothetical protein